MVTPIVSNQRFRQTNMRKDDRDRVGAYLREWMLTLQN
jgi:hypothetical protein